MMPFRTLSVVVLSGLCAGVFGVACEAEQQTAPERIRPVLYHRVERAGGPRSRTLSGVSEAGTESVLSFKVPGQITELPVKVGDTVRRRQRLAELDPTDYKLRLKQAEASRSNARAQRRNAQAAYNRVRALYANQNASRSDLDAAQAAFESARANMQAASQAHSLAKQQLSYTKLTAPVSGSIAQVDVEVNENVGAGQPIIKLTSGSRPKVTVALPESLISKVERGDEVEVTFSAVAGETFSAVVSEVAVEADASGAAFPVTAIINADPELIRPGMAAAVTFVFIPEGEEAGDDRYIVPSSAVGQDRDGKFVFIVVESPEGGLPTVRRQEVTVAEEMTSDGLEITNGVSEGDLVVTAGVSKIQDGMTVRLPNVEATAR